MLEELQSKIEAAQGRLSGLSDDIERMRSIEDALIETDKSIAASGNDLKSFVDAASSTHQSLIDAADAFKDAANALGMIDAVKLSEAISAGNDHIRAEILRTEAKSHEELDNAARRIVGAVTETINETNAEIGRSQESARQDLKTVEKRLIDSVVASGEATLQQMDSSTAELNKASQRALFPLKLIGGATLLVAIGALVIAALILVNG